MSFRIWKRGEGAASPAGREVLRAEAPSPAVLPPELLAASGRRVTTFALTAAGALTIFGIIDRSFGTFGPGSAAATLWIVAVGGGVAASLVMAWIAGRSMLAPERLLDVALVYEVAMALFLSLDIHSVPFRDGVPRGWSGVAVWTLAFPLVVPSTRGKAILATLAASAMDPIGLMFQVAAGVPAPHGAATWIMFVPTAIAATIAIVVSGIVYQLNVQAEKGHEMGSYHLEELLGSGGMGEVWKASHRLLARSAAIKLIRPDSSGSDGRESIKRFEREVQAAAGLQSPHTVNIYDFGTTEDGTFYYVMELLEGFDLETLVEKFGALPAERAVSILIQACQSLAEAHQGGLIHRDVKPANIYLCRYGLEWDFVKLLDFGLVKNTATAGHERQLTMAGVIAGTPGYMAPEIGLGESDIDWRADIYALGAVGYWLVTGNTVFDAKRPAMQIIMDHVQKTPVPPSRRTTNRIPPALDEILLSCLQKDPNNRPQTMQDLAQALHRVPLEEEWTEERARRWWLANAWQTRAAPALKAAPVSTPSAQAPLAAGMR